MYGIFVRFDFVDGTTRRRESSPLNGCDCSLQLNAERTLDSLLYSKEETNKCPKYRVWLGCSAIIVHLTCRNRLPISRRPPFAVAAMFAFCTRRQKKKPGSEATDEATRFRPHMHTHRTHLISGFNDSKFYYKSIVTYLFCQKFIIKNCNAPHGRVCDCAPAHRPHIERAVNQFSVEPTAINVNSVQLRKYGRGPFPSTRAGSPFDQVPRSTYFTQLNTYFVYFVTYLMRTVGIFVSRWRV